MKTFNEFVDSINEIEEDYFSKKVAGKKAFRKGKAARKRGERTKKSTSDFVDKVQARAEKKAEKALLAKQGGDKSGVALSKWRKKPEVKKKKAMMAKKAITKAGGKSALAKAMKDKHNASVDQNRKK